MITTAISPILADLSQDIAGAIPLELILLWNTSDKTDEKHLELLRPYVRNGTVVSSDSAGLSKLSAKLDLLDVMQLVSQPKEVIHAYGKAIGGRGIGTWVADNTQMFYDEKISTQDVIEAMICAQKEIQQLTVQVGMGVHRGKFWEIGGGLYGEESDNLEELAENYTAGGEIAVTKQAKQYIAREYLQYFRAHEEYPDAYVLDYSSQSPGAKKSSDGAYPYPFDDEFYHFLSSYDRLAKAKRQLHIPQFLQKKTVVLIRVFHQQQHQLLEQLTSYIVANAYLNQTLSSFPEITKIKSNGNLAIFVCDESDVALTFAQTAFEKLKSNDFIVNVGVTAGDVLLFPMKEGYEIAGGPVNIASKLAEDSRARNKILVEQSVKVNDAYAEPFSFTISSVEITGKYI